MARDVSKLHPILQYKMEQLKELCRKQGLIIGIGECLRTIKEQDALYAKGRTEPGGIVTNAKGITYDSMHQWGIAFDFYRNDGKGAYNESGNFFEKVGKLAQTLGLEWGGDWKSFKDKPHIQLPYWGSTPSVLKKRFQTPNRFFNTWNYEVPKKTVKMGSSTNDIYWVQIQICRVTIMNITIDGNWGEETKNAIYKYQKMLGWNATGHAGTKTVQALLKNRTK